MLISLYAVVNRGGKFKRIGYGRSTLAVARRKTAERYATEDGDSVVALTWDTDQEPLFIRRSRVTTEE